VIKKLKEKDLGMRSRSPRVLADLGYRKGVGIVTMARGGLMYEASVGGQKFSYKPSGRSRKASQRERAPRTHSGSRSPVLLPRESVGLP
jgi:hypothetical protein